MKNQKNNPGQQQGSGTEKNEPGVNRGSQQSGSGQDQRNQSNEDRGDISQESPANTNRGQQAEQTGDQPRMGKDTTSDPHRQPLGSSAERSGSEEEETTESLKREGEQEDRDQS
jgi:hypothetical protein